MRIERNEAQIGAIEKFSKITAELINADSKRAITELAKEGIAFVSEKKERWGLTAPSLQSTSRISPSISLGASMNLLCADLLRRNTSAIYLSIVSKIESGESVAALVAKPWSPLTPKAKVSGDKISISGNLGQVCNAAIADYFVVLASGEKGMNLLCIEKGAAGLHVGEKVDTIGVKGIPIAPVSLNDVLVGKDKVVELPAVEVEALKARWSLCIAAILCGINIEMLEEVKKFVNLHNIGDKPVAKFQAPRFQVAEAFASLETSILMLDRAAFSIDDNDREMKTLCDSARILADDATEELAVKGTRVLGASGTEAGMKFRKLMDDAETVRFAGEHPDALLSSIFDFVAKQY